MRLVRVAAFLFAASMCLAHSGCAAIQAVRTPGPTPEHNVEAGMHRAEVEAILRTGASAYLEPDGTIRARYEYVDGPHPATKIRAIVWIAADVFSLFLSELLLWPIEIVIASDAERSADVVFDANNRVLQFRAFKTKNRQQTHATGQLERLALGVEDDDGGEGGAGDGDGDGDEAFDPETSPGGS